MCSKMMMHAFHCHPELSRHPKRTQRSYFMLDNAPCPSLSVFFAAFLLIVGGEIHESFKYS